MDKQLLASQLQAYLAEEWGEEYDDNDAVGIWDFVVDRDESELQGKSLQMLAGEYELQM